MVNASTPLGLEHHLAQFIHSLVKPFLLARETVKCSRPHQPTQGLVPLPVEEPTTSPFSFRITQSE